jgi:hypothetical protein
MRTHAPKFATVVKWAREPEQPISSEWCRKTSLTVGAGPSKAVRFAIRPPDAVVIYCSTGVGGSQTNAYA